MKGKTANEQYHDLRLAQLLFQDTSFQKFVNAYKKLYEDLGGTVNSSKKSLVSSFTSLLSSNSSSASVKELEDSKIHITILDKFAPNGQVANEHMARLNSAISVLKPKVVFEGKDKGQGNSLQWNVGVAGFLFFTGATVMVKSKPMLAAIAGAIGFVLMTVSYCCLGKRPVNELNQDIQREKDGIIITVTDGLAQLDLQFNSSDSKVIKAHKIENLQLCENIYNQRYLSRINDTYSLNKVQTQQVGQGF
jgi:hypothetical protein